MKGQKLGFKRVSGIDHNTARQLDYVRFDRFFEDEAGGKDPNRPQLRTNLDRRSCLMPDDQ